MRRAALFAAAIIGAAIALAFWQARDPAGDAPDSGFDLAAFFEGRSISAGTITTAVFFEEAFTATFNGTRLGEAFRLEERFAFEDGERLQVWTLTRAEDGRLEGTVETERKDGALAAPVAVAGTSDGSGVTLDYHGIAPGGGVRLHFRHHMRMQADGTVANHVVISKFGLPLATSSVTFAKDAGALPSPSSGG